MKHARYLLAAATLALIAGFTLAWFWPSSRMRPCEGHEPFSCWTIE